MAAAETRRRSFGSDDALTLVTSAATSSSGHGPNDQERLFAFDYRARENSLRRVQGQVLFAGKEPDKGAAPQRAMIPNCAAQDRVGRFQGVEHRTEGWRVCGFNLHLAADT